MAHHVESLDVFRGIIVAAMILVNNPGDWNAVFPPLLHAYWTGCTIADLVFPAFIVIMGFTMPLSFARRKESGSSLAHLYGRVARRAALLTLLGLMLNAIAAWPDAPLRIPGVLQRIALSYLLAAPVVLHLPPSRWPVAVAALLLGHWALLALVPFDGHPAGTLTPDHNLARFVDTLVFGTRALTIPNDPEGLLGTLPAAGTALAGAIAGEHVRRARNHAARLQGLVTGGAIALAVGAIWSRALPLSKPLWTGSFVMVAAGFTALTFALTYLIVDVRGPRRWSRPFLWLGVNALAMYFLSEIGARLFDRAWVQHGVPTTPKGWLFWEILQPAFDPLPAVWASFAFGAAFAGVAMAVAGVLYRWRIRIRV